MKRVFDISVSLISIILLFPLFIMISLLIKITSKGPIIFKQKRSGKNRCEFNIYKFRSMKINTPNVATNELYNHSDYITGVGRFIRRTSIDELPQLFNILKGDMSIVGPRPLLCSEIDVLDRRELYNANSIRPGLTGLAQINGRDNLDSIAKASFDGQYMMNRSFLYDIKIILKTFLYVLGAKDIKEGIKNEFN